MVRKFWEEITLPGYKKIVAEIGPGNATENMRLASRFFREQGRAVAPDAVHGIDIVTDKPHIFAERTEADEIDKVLKPGMIIMAEPNPITADGMFGIFLGHTFIVTKDGHECVDNFPLEIAVAPVLIGRCADPVTAVGRDPEFEPRLIRNAGCSVNNRQITVRRCRTGPFTRSRVGTTPPGNDEAVTAAKRQCVIHDAMTAARDGR